MTGMILQDIQVGWKVFVGSEEVGHVVDVGSEDIGVRHGRLIKTTTRIPGDRILEASDGVVDLRADDDTMDRLSMD